MEKFNEGDGVWRTIGGRRVFIRTGQSLSDAMRESGKFKTKSGKVKKEDSSKEAKEENIDKEEKNLSRAEKNKGLYEQLEKEQKKDISTNDAVKDFLQADTGNWNSMNQNQRDKQCEKILNDFEKKYGNKLEDKDFRKEVLDGLEDKNFHTMGKIIEQKYEKGGETKLNAGIQLSQKQIEAGNKLNANAEKGVRDDIKAFLSGKENYDGSQKDFIRDLSDNWGVDKDKVEDILHEENLKHPRNFKSQESETFIQNTNMYGGTREYNKEQLDRMKENGMKPMKDSYTGGGWEGTKYDSKLSTKEIAKNITDYSKKEFPDVKLSRKTDYNGVDIHVMSSDKDLYVSASDIDKMSDKQVSDTIGSSVGGYTRLDEWLDKNGRKTANNTFTANDERDYLKEELSNYKSRKGDNVVGNEWYLSDYGKKVISGLNKEMNSYNYDDSDGMVDYFNTNFYGYVHIGKWDKPYESKSSSSSSSDWVREAFNKYRQDHPASKMTFEDFKKSNK